MNIVKGFATINSQTNNAPNVVATLGELSGFSRTFAKDPKYYRNNRFPEVGLSVFSVKDDDGNDLTVNEAQSEHALEIISWAAAEAKAGRFTLESSTFHDAVTADQAQIAAQLEFGDMMGDENVVLPEYMQWSYMGLIFKIWFSDYHFQIQYDDFEHEVVQPIEHINDFQRPYSEIHEEIITDSNEMLRRANAVNAKYPYTALVPVDVEWIDRSTGNSHFITWLVAVYGPNGNNPVNWEEALRRHILSNSDFNETEWNDVMPELFKPTEFIIIPSWDMLSVPETMAVEGIYNPTLRYRDMIAKALRFTHRYELEHIEEHLTHSAHIYKSLGFLAIGNDGNRDGVYSLEQKFPGYNLLNSTELDFNRIDPHTQEWMKLIHRMLITAEIQVDETILPVGLTRLRRNGVIFTVANYDQVNYLIVTKESHNALWPYEPLPDNGGDDGLH